MAYKPTEPRWVLARVAFFIMTVGLPWYVVMWLLGVRLWLALGIAALLVAVAEHFVEALRRRNEDDGEHRG